MKIKINLKKVCVSLMVLACSCFIAGSAHSYSSEAVRFYNQGIENVKNEQYEEAAENFRKAIFQDKSLNDAYFNLGSVYRELGETDKAKEILSVLLRRDPFDDEAVFYLGKLYFDLEEYESALVYLNTITDLSLRHDNARELIFSANNKIEEKKLSEIKTSRDWSKQTLDGFDAPAGVAGDSEGNIYIANYKANVIQKISDDLKQRKNYTSEELQGPLGLAVDSEDNLYVSGYISNNIIRISRAGEVKVILKDVQKPYYLSIKDDILYITEQENNTLIMVNLWELE